MVIGRRLAIATLAAALLLSLSACADFWKFQTLQDLGGSDAGVDATMPDSSSSGEDGASLPDVVASPDGPGCTMCGGKCIDPMTDLQNCGGCGNACLTSQVCQGGMCVCTANQMPCGTGATAACIDPMTDHGNCGGCGKACASGTDCQMGACVCPGMEMLCTTGATPTCAYLTSDHNNCGGCGNACSIGGSCQNGVCACPAGQQTCGTGAAATCVDETVDHNNCGGCGNICPSTETCSNSVCVPCASIGPTGLMCGTPLTCVNTATDHTNCGGCGQPCLATETCQGGTCKCPGTEALCGSGAAEGCVTLASDQNNCGKCGTQCTGGMVCTNSVCVCPGGYHPCGGTCVPDASTSTSSCGTTCSLCPMPVRGMASCSGTPLACGQSCPTAATPTLCNKGANATCVNTTNDTGNCGACGATCSTNHATEACTASSCAISMCAAGYADCNKSAADGCEINTNTNVANCGGCGMACNMTGGVEGCVGGKCTNPVCNAPNADCDKNPATGCEVNTSTDKINCGSCGHACPTGTNCTGGVCSNCAAGTLLCGSVNGVGGTCAACPPSPTNGTLVCMGTMCVASCPNATFPTPCGNACVNTNTDNGNCGGCTKPCSLATQSNKCEQAYACTAGVCTGSNPVTCPAPVDACHSASTCTPATGTCTASTPLTSTPCTNSNECEQTYTCQAGVCTGSNPVTCTASDSCHVPGTCQSGNGMCTAQTNEPDGTSCSVTTPNKCDTYSCKSGTCTPTTAITCTANDGCHTVGTCNPMTGICFYPNEPDGTACVGSNLCMSYACMTGVCTATGSAGTCTPPDQCHSSACNAGTGMCVNTPLNGTACNDGNACTQTDTCVAGVCTGSNPVSCTASDQCHVPGVCDPGSGVCSNPPATNGNACTDNNACTQGDSCQGGTCMPGASVTCMAGTCQVVGACSPASGCPMPTTAPDNTPCTGAASGTVCVGGTCQCPARMPTPCPGNGGNVCVDMTSDPNNCGVCGMVCAAPDAGEPAMCVSSMCVE